MASANPFDLLGDDDAEDPSLLAAAAKRAAPPPSQAAKQPPGPAAAKLPSKPLPPAQAVREARNEGGRGGGRGGGGGRGYSRGRGGYSRDFASSEQYSGYSAPGQGAREDSDGKRETERRGPRDGSQGGRRVSFSNGEGDGRPRRDFERRSGTGRGSEIKREGSGRGNWGTQADEHAQITEEVAAYGEKNLGDDKALDQEATPDATKDTPNAEPEEKEPEDKEMTLEEYEKVLEEKRKALQALKTEERKVDSEAFQSMQQLSNKKANDDIFIKLGSEKDKRKEALEKDEKSKKAVSINEFLKPAEGERYYSPGGRGRGRGRGRGGGGREFGGGAREFGGRDSTSSVMAPAIGDPGQFPTLGGK